VEEEEGGGWVDKRRRGFGAESDTEKDGRLKLVGILALAMGDGLG
jgi:hypothetical protein